MRGPSPGPSLVASGLLLLAVGCAGALRSPRGAASDTDVGRGWMALVDGNSSGAKENFSRALARDPSDARALFGTANLDYEHGDDDGALAGALGLLEAASRGQDSTARALAAATLSRMPRLLSEIPDRRPAEARLIALSPEKLPWQAQYALALMVIDIARKRADEGLLAKASARAGCARAIDYVGTGGRLPMLDLEARTFTPAERVLPLVPAGCQFQLNTPDGRMGIKVLRAEISSPAGHHDIVLDFAGPARLRVDGGPWHEHGASLDVYGPRWSAAPVDLAAGKHSVEIRIGVYGSSADLALLAIPSARTNAEAASGVAPADEAMMNLAGALQANLAGDSDAASAHIQRLAARQRFALGLAAAARLGEMDVTRPMDISRDEARSRWRQALVVDAEMARVWLDLSNLEMQQERPREAAENAERGRQAAPAWWPAQLGLATALRAQGLEQPADAALAKGLSLVEGGFGACQVLEKAFHRKQDREDVASAARLVEALARCDAQSAYPRTWAHERGDTDKELALLRRALPSSAEPTWLRAEIADVDIARVELAAAHEELAALVQLLPRDTRTVLRLADSEKAMGKPDQARATLVQALRRFPGRQDVRRAGRLAGLALPLDDFRVDGAKVVSDFLASGKSYQAPAVVVLDRAVEQVFPDGTRLMLTHSITRVLSKDAVEHVGEVHVPSGAEILALRTRKADGTLREAEEIVGKSSISAPNLGVGDFVESETLEVKEPREALAPGFIGERFYFRSFDAPLHRSEYVFIAPVSMKLDVDQRAGAPLANETAGPDGTRILTFLAREQSQVFPERSAVSAMDWLPSVRVSSGVATDPWSRFIADRFARIVRGSPDIRRVAAEISRQAGGDHGRAAQAIVDWVREHIEPENDFTEPATATLAHGRGNRAGLVVALARALGVPADLVLARSLLIAAADAPITPCELDDFRDVLVRFPLPGGDRFVDPQLRRAPFAYLHAGDDGAPAVVVGSSAVVKGVSAVADMRKVALRARLASDGSAEVVVTEDLLGWPAVEWNEMLESAGKDRSKLRQGFEQHWLGHHFPGAQLDTLTVEPGVETGRTKVKYAFKAARFADRQGDVLFLRPTFFRSQPGRRFGTEPQRKTALLLGYDVPVELDAEFVLPAGAKVLDVGQGGEVSVGEARFIEERRTGGGDGTAATITLRRRSRLPIMRVAAADYQRVAAKLRAVDPIEQAEIRIAVPAKSAASAGAASAPGQPAGASAPRAIPSTIPFVSLEGPFWVASGGYLIFSDVVEQNGAAATIYRYDPGTAAFSTVDYPGSPVSTNGLAVDGAGRLLACERWNGTLARVSGGKRSVVADRSPTGRSLNAPNDLTLRKDGNLYFSDTRWGARPGEHAPGAVYRVSPEGRLSVAFQVDMPNGVLLSPDGRTLYVGSDTQDRLWRLPVAPDGSVGKPESFASAGVPAEGRIHVPDGLCVDDLGRVYVTNNSTEVSAIVIFDRDGHYAGRIPFPVPPSNCTFGGADRRTLYVTTLHAIYEVRTDTPGLP